ncbi:tRNA guanosine-2'-O-methyltransferase [Alternaria panax]|uniref:tRNA guanosine-2'-O-methyltransferase n=1 Tax=Alternaria panax TaxID=48097 RepID=A0AAD4NQ15_9PLEO|nr:tRNA guanosine-2'-O-methyltransferase [Alternaria panax]
MATAAVLSLLDEQTRRAAFEGSLAKLKAAPGVDMNALDICVRLLPTESAGQEETDTSQYEELWDTVLDCLVDEQSSENLYQIAEICHSHTSHAASPLSSRLNHRLSTLVEDLSSSEPHPDSLKCAKAYLNFLKCSFWIPVAYSHMVDPWTLPLLSNFIGIDGLDDTAHDTLSAFFSLLKSKKEDSLAHLDDIVDQSIWDRLNALDMACFAARSSKIYRTWFQWISLAASGGVKLECVSDEEYWRKLRLGLVKGHADQRKYCLGIIRQSFLATPTPIDTPTIRYDASKQDREQYDLYSTLFETIVLHRYSGQVEDCLKSMTTLLGSSSATKTSRITPAMATTLLTAALNPLIQESVRKMIGGWYMDFVTKRLGDLNGHIDFLFAGFLPWAMDGGLFTSSLTATRSLTKCAHGERLAAVISHFVSDTEDSPSFVPSVDYSGTEIGIDNRNGRAIILGVVRYIAKAGGKMFQPAILYLLHGLIEGLKTRCAKRPAQFKMDTSEIAEILSLSRLPGMPEVASDLHSIHCRKLCDLLDPDSESKDIPTNETLRAKCQKLEHPVDQSTMPAFFGTDEAGLPSIHSFVNNLHESKHGCIQGPAFAPACKSMVELLNRTEVADINPNHLHTILAALWEEAEIRDFIRPFAVHLPPLLFHPTCINVCVANGQGEDGSESELAILFSKAMLRLTKLSKGRSYVLAVLAQTLRKAAFTNPSIISMLPFEDYILDFVNDPASIRSEFLFEVTAADKLQQYLPHRTYASYYGMREWHAYAAVIDLLRRFPEEQTSAAQRIFDQLLQPWKDQRPPVAVKSPWKRTFQLQALLSMSHYCVTESNVDAYLDGLTHALTLESWPRYRYLLEWTIARIYRQFPGKSLRIVKELGDLEEYSPVHIASLIKLGLLVAPYESQDFAVKLITELNAYSASPKVQIRHEANFAFPLVFELAITKGWKDVVDNTALAGMNTFIRRLDKFNASPWTIRTLKVDIEQDFTLAGIFQGRYLSIETPEEEVVTHDDFETLERDDQSSHVNQPPARIPLGKETRTNFDVVAPAAPTTIPSTPEPTGQITLQTKAGIDLDNLHPPSGPPNTQNQRPSSVMLIASLIDNPTNLGGLSRISESFGLESLYIDDLKKVAHKDFKATSVRSEKHLSIKELKEVSVPAFLLEAKSKGYEVVGIEQTDRSGILGTENGTGEAVDGDEEKVAKMVRSQDIGTLPRKCCLVLGSEKEGISAEVLAVIDRNVEIKTVGVTRSLNVQTAGGIALYEWWREWGGKA